MRQKKGDEKIVNFSETQLDRTVKFLAAEKLPYMESIVQSAAGGEKGC